MVKNGRKFLFWTKEKILQEAKKNERENRIIYNFSETFLRDFLKIGSLVVFNVQNNF